MKRFLALLIACLMIVTCFVACDIVETDDKDAETDGDQSTNTGDDDKKDENNGGENSGDENNGGENSGDENNGGENAGDENNGGENSGDENNGDENNGGENNGDENTGDENNGDENTGDGNTNDDNNGEPEDPFKGKTCVTFGDSITWYDGNAYTWGKEHKQIAKGFQSYMRDELGLRVINKGYSGQTMPQIMNNLKTFSAATYKSADYLTIMSGANDERRNTPLGTIAAKGSNFNTSTYIGALQSGIEYVLAANPDIKIVLFTPIVGWIYADGDFGADGRQEGYAYDYDKDNQPTVDGIITEKWANAVKEVAELYGLTVCDLYNDCEIQYEIADREAYMNDPEPPTNKLYSLHPNTAGYRKMADTIIATFREMVK